MYICICQKKQKQKQTWRLVGFFLWGAFQIPTSTSLNKLRFFQLESSHILHEILTCILVVYHPLKLSLEIKKKIVKIMLSMSKFPLNYDFHGLFLKSIFTSCHAKITKWFDYVGN